ncbi:MAG: energy transducer TonB [Pseudomonadota bacterium]
MSLSFGLLAACASTDTQYQITSTGGIQSKADAENAYAADVAQMRWTPTLDSPPRVLSSPFPDYPSNLRRADISGRVLVKFIVEPNGSISEPAVQGSPPAELAELALDAIKKWKFSPAVKGGAAVRTRMSQTFVFALH